jgi:branched-chain amino acid transport system substrate-binding protein
MRRILTTTYILLALSLMAWAGYTHPRNHPYRKVFFDARKHQTSYEGPGREERPPTDIKEVLIGYFGPGTSSHPKWGDMWCAACLAIDQANQKGGYNGFPFRLVAGWSENPWSSGISKVVRMAYVDRVWAVIGGIDGPSTHLAEQVAAKARLTLLSPGSTDKTVNLANVPWMFSCLPGDHLQAPVLAHAIASHTDKSPFLLVSAVDHDSHLFTVELAKSLAQCQLVPFYHLEFSPKERNIEGLVEKIVHANVNALVLIAGACESAQIICAVREKNFTGLVFGGPGMGRRSFLEQAGKAANDVVFPLLYTPGKSSNSFEENFASRFGNRSDYLAAHTYDAVNLLIAAIRQAGLNRARICDEVRRLSPWQGVTGSIHWDSLGSNSRSVGLGTIRNGRVEPLSETKSTLLTYVRFSNCLR